VTQVTTADRADAQLYRAWNRALTPVGMPAWPHAGSRIEEYTGRHRRSTSRRFSFRALFHFARHRR
jgi:hypothetical protein